MAKIGTVHVEVKPVVNEEEWIQVCERLEDQVAKAIWRGVKRGWDNSVQTINLGTKTFTVRQPDGSTIQVEGTHLGIDSSGVLGIYDRNKETDS